MRYYHHSRAAWLQTQDGLIEIYFKHKRYNVWHICEQVSHTNPSYVNIAVPPTLQGSGMVWIDLDLDYRVHLDSPAEMLDQEEFEQSRQLMGCPANLVDHAHLACREVEAGLAIGAYPFDHERQVELYCPIEADLRGSAAALPLPAGSELSGS